MEIFQGKWRLPTLRRASKAWTFLAFERDRGAGTDGGVVHLWQFARFPDLLCTCGAKPARERKQTCRQDPTTQTSVTYKEGGLPTFAASRTNGRDAQTAGFTKAGASVYP
jgi:hypothetical protein